MRYAIEVKTEKSRWIKFRLGSCRGRQVMFDDEQKAKDYLRRSGMSPDHYRIKTKVQP